MTQTTGVAILATQLADTDRRALSQAWYSALHLAAHDDPAAHAAAPRRTRTRVMHASPAAARNDRERAVSSARAVVPRLAQDARRPPAATRATPERREQKSELARRIERALVAPQRRGAGSFVVNAAGGRVQVLVRIDGPRLRLVALCAPALRARVERALAQARYALALRGTRPEAS
jgi:hypothetical protein